MLYYYARIYDTIPAFYIIMKKFYGTITAFYVNMSEFYGTIPDFYVIMPEFYGTIPEFSGNEQKHKSNVRGENRRRILSNPKQEYQTSDNNLLLRMVY
jgi:hypothetical protein